MIYRYVINTQTRTHAYTHKKTHVCLGIPITSYIDLWSHWTIIANDVIAIGVAAAVVATDTDVTRIGLTSACLSVCANDGQLQSTIKQRHTSSHESRHKPTNTLINSCRTDINCLSAPPHRRPTTILYKNRWCILNPLKYRIVLVKWWCFCSLYHQWMWILFRSSQIESDRCLFCCCGISNSVLPHPQTIRLNRITFRWVIQYFFNIYAIYESNSDRFSLSISCACVAVQIENKLLHRAILSCSCISGSLRIFKTQLCNCVFHLVNKRSKNPVLSTMIDMFLEFNNFIPRVLWQWTNSMLMMIICVKYWIKYRRRA